MASILTYHKIGRQFEFGITTVSRGRFREHLDFLKSLGRRLEVAGEAAGDAPGDATDAVALTFDDGYESVFTDALPEMLDRGVPGTVFVVVGAVGGLNTWDVRLSPRPFKHLSWRQIGELSRHGFEIGSHTVSHRDLTRLSDVALRRELTVSRREIEDRTGIGVRAVAYPFGKADRRVQDAARAAGFERGFLSSPGGAEVMAAGRMSVYSIDGVRSLRRKLGLAVGHRFEVLKSKAIVRLSHGTTLVKR
jgi:peptidoglycan/xylan/chitin deacetylase (PgdA/CDA1 family)